MKRFKVVYKNLKKAWGFADLEKNVVILDSKLTGKKHLEILIHEQLHLLLPDISEESVENASIMMTNTIWQEKYRRIDDRNDLPLQDGSK